MDGRRKASPVPGWRRIPLLGLPCFTAPPRGFWGGEGKGRGPPSACLPHVGTETRPRALAPVASERVPHARRGRPATPQLGDPQGPRPTSSGAGAWAPPAARGPRGPAGPSSAVPRPSVASCREAAKKRSSSFLLHAKPRAARPTWGRRWTPRSPGRVCAPRGWPCCRRDRTRGPARYTQGHCPLTRPPTPGGGPAPHPLLPKARGPQANSGVRGTRGPVRAHEQPGAARSPLLSSCDMVTRPQRSCPPLPGPPWGGPGRGCSP